MYIEKAYISTILFDYSSTRLFPFKIYLPKTCGLDACLRFHEKDMKTIYNTILNFVKNKESRSKVIINGVEFIYREDDVLNIHFSGGYLTFWYRVLKAEVLPFLLRCLIKNDVISLIID